jgi:hypothetical protein
MIDLYFSIRGLQIFHWWSNPSINIIDKEFIEERIKGVIFIATKEKTRPRMYYYFRKTDLLKIWEKFKSLNLNLLKKISKDYAYYRGWFKDYKGDLLQPYLEKKDKRMDEKVEDFFDKYGEMDLMSRSSILKNLRIGERTLFRYEVELIERGELTQNLDFYISATGRRKYTKEAINKFKELAHKKHLVQLNGL